MYHGFLQVISAESFLNYKFSFFTNFIQNVPERNYFVPSNKRRKMNKYCKWLIHFLCANLHFSKKKICRIMQEYFSDLQCFYLFTPITRAELDTRLFLMWGKSSALKRGTLFRGKNKNCLYKNFFSDWGKKKDEV